jgi:DNA-binding NarL/FixJ family response regulator
VRVLFVEFHSAFRQAASLLLDGRPDLEVVAQAGSVAEGLRKMALGGIDAAIVDIPLPDEGATDLVRELCGANPSVPVLVLTTIEDRDVHEEFAAAGAGEVLSKRITAEEVVAAVRRLAGGEPEADGVKVLISYEESHLSYRDIVAEVIRELRPQAEVRTVYLRALGDEIERVDPHLVICSRPNTLDPGGRAAWVKLAAEPEDTSEACVAGRRRVLENPGLEVLLEIVDETAEMVRGYRVPGGC